MNDPPYLFPDYVATRLRAPAKPMLELPRTPSELTGPVFGDGAVRPGDQDLTAGGPLGERIVVSGRLEDSEGRPIRYSGAYTSANMFDILRVRPILGRPSLPLTLTVST